MFLTFKAMRHGKVAVYSGTKRVGTIAEHGKYIRTDARYLDAIEAYVASRA